MTLDAAITVYESRGHCVETVLKMTMMIWTGFEDLDDVVEFQGGNGEI